MIVKIEDKQYLVDANDWSKFGHLKWRCGIGGYAYYPTYINGKKRNLWFHKVVMGVDRSTEVDHIDGNVFNNLKDNLRLATRTQNNYNRGISKNNKSGFKGVYVIKRLNKWASCIMKNKHLGVFNTARQAALAYDLWATDLFGEFARRNNKMVLFGKK